MQAEEVPALDDFLDRAAAMVAEHVDLPRLRRLARPFGLGLYGPAAQPLRPLGQRIAVARDVGLCVRLSGRARRLARGRRRDQVLLTARR